MQRRLGQLSVLCLLLLAGVTHAEWYQDTQAIMGTRVHVEFYLPDRSDGPQLLAQVMDEMHRIDATFSSYKDTSELSRLNREAPNGWTEVSPELFDLLSKAHQVSELTECAFDVTYASVGRYYDYRQAKAPDAQVIAKAVQGINYKYV